jgi:CDP-diacylglycerol--serine O-phosphatidyltransferase
MLANNDHIEFNKQQQGLRRRGIYLIPNLLTTVGMCAGFYAVIVAMQSVFDAAAVAIFVATIADGLDGRVARLTGTQSTFGGCYDSMADMLSFGVAPGLVVYNWSLSHLGKIGWLIAFWYTAATALRLARFNTQLHNPENKQYSQGLTCTAAASMMASTIWLSASNSINGHSVAIPVAILTMLVSCLMVSNVRYYLFKDWEAKGRVTFITVVIAVLLITAIALDPPEILFSLFGCYVLSGPILTYWKIKKMKNKKNQ